MNAIVRLPHPRSGDSQGQETFLAPSADKQTRNYDRGCSNQNSECELNSWPDSSRLERLNGIQWSWVKIPLRPTFYSYFKESSSGEYHMYQLITLHSCDYLKKLSMKINVATDEGKSQNEM